MTARRTNPLTYAAGYTLNLYCDQNKQEWDHQTMGEFYAETFGECAKSARQRGWVIHKDRTATCPTCNRKATIVHRFIDFTAGFPTPC